MGTATVDVGARADGKRLAEFAGEVPGCDCERLAACLASWRACLLGVSSREARLPAALSHPCSGGTRRFLCA